MRLLLSHSGPLRFYIPLGFYIMIGHRMPRMLKTLLAVLAAGLIPAAASGGAMPAAQETALVQKYCAVCHSDAHMNGGLSLEHFDAAHPDPGVAAMLVSKLTNGLSPKQVAAWEHDPSGAAMIAGKMKVGAMGAAGLPVPDRATQDALVSALSADAAGYSEWTVSLLSPILTASIVREVPSPKSAGNTDIYRLTLTCHADTHEAQMVLAWAPGASPKGQTVSAAIDGKPPITFQVDGSEKMFQGTVGTMGTGATILSVASLPGHSLTITNLFPDETVVFPFGDLAQTARQELSKCVTSPSKLRPESALASGPAAGSP